MKRRFAIALLLVVAILAGCSRSDQQQTSTTLDTVGSKIKQGAEKVGEKLDTAVSGIKTSFNEAEIQRMLHKMNGMDSVKIELTSGGDVILKGSVPSQEKRTEAQRIVQEIKGVHNVIDSLVIGTSRAD